MILKIFNGHHTSIQGAKIWMRGDTPITKRSCSEGVQDNAAYDTPISAVLYVPCYVQRHHN